MSTLITNTLQGINTIKYDANTTAATIDSTGRVLQPAKPAFKAYMTGNQSAPSANTFTTIQFNAENYDIGGNFNTSTYTFTTPVAGVYYFYTSYSYVANVGSESQGIVSLAAGGSTIAGVDFYIKGSNARYGSCCSTVVQLNAGVGVTARAYGPARGIYGGDYGNTQFCGYLVG